MDNPIFHIRRNARLLGMLRQVPRRLLPQKIKSFIRSRILPAAPKPMDSIRIREQARVDEEKGLLAGNLHFWTTLPSRDWADVQSRLFLLAQANQEGLIEDFLHHSIAIGKVAPHLPLLARSGLAREALTHVLGTADYSPNGDMAPRFQQSIQFTVNAAAAALYLFDEKDVAPILDCISRVYPILPHAYHATLDSQAVVPARRPTSLHGTVPFAPSRRSARHRLIILDSLKDPTRISLLFAGAEEVTVFSPNDLYGKLSFDDIPLHHKPSRITVAHPRSRITRFSSRYHEIHEETRQIAEELVGEIERNSEGFLSESAPYMSLLVSDKLFFPVLSTAACEDFLAAEEFDQIVIASTGYLAQETFFKSLASGIDLSADTRIEFTALTPTQKYRNSFGRELAAAFRIVGLETVRQPANDALTRPLTEIIAEAEQSFWPASAKMRSFPASFVGKLSRTGRALGAKATKPPSRVLYITTRIGAYDASSGQYLDILSRQYNTLTGFIGANTSAFFSSLPPGVLPPKAANIQLLGSSSASEQSRIGTYMSGLIDKYRARLLREGRGRLSAHVLDTKRDDIALGALTTGLAHWISLQHWFERLAANNHLPDLVVLSPLRPPLVGMAAAAARRFGVPSMALEAHGLNASYCRYTQVGTDRYGVVSTYFRDEASRGFGIPSERVDVIGSPRLRAPADYDVVTRRTTARAAVAEASGVTFAGGDILVPFFTQPSNWHQISEVWKIILSSVRDLQGVRLLLQPHPEEGPARLSGYQAIAEELGMTDRVTTVDASAIEVIEAADLVLACYSATIVEAALYRKPVFAVKDGDGDYPLNQNEVVGAPMFRDAESLRQGISAFLADPAPFHKQAEDFLAREPQLITGPEPRLVEVVDAMLSRPASENLRPPEDLPKHLFIDGPHRVFDV